MRRRELLQLADERRVPSEPELGVDSLLLRRQPQLVEPFGREPGEVLLADVYERRPAPEPERVTQQLDPPSEIRAPRGLEQRLEAIDVDVLASHGKPVARRLCDEHVPADQLAERRDGVLQRSGRGRRRPLPPEVGNEPVGRDDLTGTQRQGGEQRTLLPARQRDDPVAVPDLERPKEADFHRIGCNTGNNCFQGERGVSAA